jgi:hypothetical protein
LGDLGLLARIVFPIFPVFVTQFPVASLQTCLPSFAFGELGLHGFLLPIVTVRAGDLGLLARIAMPILPAFVTQFPVASLQTCLPSFAFGELGLHDFLPPTVTGEFILGDLVRIVFPILPVFVTQFPVASLQTCLPSFALGELGLHLFLNIYYQV